MTHTTMDVPRVDTIKVLLVDDHQILTAGLARFLAQEPDLLLVGCASSLQEALTLTAARRPDVILLDHHLPDGLGGEHIHSLLSIAADVKILLLTANTSADLLQTSLRQGARGLLSKSGTLTEVPHAIRSVHDGQIFRTAPRQRTSGETASRAVLNDRELQVLELLAQGLANRAIAEQLHLSVHTIRNHVQRLCAKLGAHSKLEALSIGLRCGLVRAAEHPAPRRAIRSADVTTAQEVHLRYEV